MLDGKCAADACDLQGYSHTRQAAGEMRNEE